MDEEKRAEKTIEKTAAIDTETGNKPAATSIVEQAKLAAEGLAKENTRMEENLRRQEELKARETLGGQTAGAQPEAKKELTPKEYADSVSKGIIPKS